MNYRRTSTGTIPFEDHLFSLTSGPIVSLLLRRGTRNSHRRSHERGPSMGVGRTGTNDKDAAWIQHCLYHLADGGRAVILLPNSVLFEGGRFGRIRQRIYQKLGLLDA